ncbi:hypothetical protein WR25_11372 [Diploscapter pachys]|uniref:Protein kinase domain-containing protein n=1 Tax=Diploscapter pachys TaxID=2018661 RepID=A0A2A2LJX6_9BILA|nr:hypothetical protein WR25_11372 [Diploscapter pachys]
MQSSTMDPGDTLKSPRGVYKIVKWLGSGKFGDVYLTDYMAKNTSNSEQVALKEIALRGIDEEEEKECKKEAELMERISNSSTSPHVVKYLDSFIEKVYTGRLLPQAAEMILPSHESLYIAMDYCSRGDLSRKIKANVKSGEEFDPETIYDYIYQIADGINELHFKHNIVHRDLKPANILIAWKNGKEVLKISGFDLATVIDSLNKTQSYSEMCGTPFYMAPEQWKGDSRRFSVDIWAIGIIFYELCIAPKRLMNEIYDLREKIMNGQRVNLPSRYSEADTIWLNKMIAKDPSKRMSSDQVRDKAENPDPPEWRTDASIAYFTDKLYYLGGWDPEIWEDTNRVDLLMEEVAQRYIDYQTMNGNGVKLEGFQKDYVLSESHR